MENKMEDDLRRLAAIMFTDIVGYSAITQTNESLAQELLKEHNEILRPIFIKWKGREVKTIGDCFLVEFVNVLDSVNCALEIQETFYKRNESVLSDRKLQIRIGIHAGDVIYRDNDVFGDGVNIASRVQKLAEPGGICLTEDVVRQVRNKINVPLVSLGAGGLKNIKLEIIIFKVLLPWKQKKLTMTEQFGKVIKSKTFLWSAAAVIILAVGLTLLAKTGYINLTAGELKPNPNMKFTEIKIPFKNFGPPGISDEGNLIAFSAPDNSKKYDVYLMYLSTMQSKRITFDSGSYISDVGISKDGSLILNRKISDSLELSLTSTLGNGKKTVLTYWAGMARISPDNRKIGFITDNYFRTQKTFSTILPDGTERKQLISDSLFGHYCFAWSPNSEDIVWIRTFKNDSTSYEELVIHNILTGHEKQITNLKERINEVEWSDDGLIYFTSQFRNKQYDLWAVSADGGKPVQLTSGSDINDAIRYANKEKKLYTYSQERRYFLWEADADGKNQRQITDDGLSYFDFCFESPGIISAVRNNGPVNEIVRINTASGEVEVLFTLNKTSGFFYNIRQFSPDLSKVAFGEIPRHNYDADRRSLDSCLLFYSDNNFKNIHPIGIGIPDFWFDDSLFVTTKYNTLVPPYSMRRYMYNVSSSSFERLADSTSPNIFVIKNTNTLLITDRNNISKYATFKSKDLLLDYLKNGGTAKFIPLPEGTFFDFISGFIRSINSDFGLTVPELKKIEIPAIQNSFMMILSGDYKKVVYLKEDLTSKVMAIDNIEPK